MSSDAQVVLLNGPAGVGKTTLGPLLAQTARNGVCIHGDDIKRFVASREPDDRKAGLTYEAGGVLATTYAEAGYELVVFEFVFETVGNIRRFLDGYSASAPVGMITLWAPFRTVADREGARVERQRLGPRVRECWESLRTAKGELGQTVDATGGVEEVLTRVLASLVGIEDLRTVR